MSALTIGQVARRAGVGIETIRFYERAGLIADPPRRASGYRAYPPEVVARIDFIRRAKELGFTLKEVGELLELKVHPRRSCATVKKNAEAKIADIDQKVSLLRKMRRSLLALTKACDARTPTDECPILESLSHR